MSFIKIITLGEIKMKALQFLKRRVFLSFYFIILIGIIIALTVSVVQYENLLNQSKIQLTQQFKKDIIDTDLEFVRQDINMYGYISPYVTDKIVKEIENSSKKYKIPIGMLHAIFRIESDYRFYITHSDVILKGGNKINAIGLGGVVWYFWGDSLIKNNIAQTMSDLYIPEINIKASAYILRIIINEEVESVNESDLLNRIITRYYGAYDKLYRDKTFIVTSDLWMKRMLNEIKNVGKIKL